MIYLYFTFKVVLIYIVFLIPFGPYLCKEKDHFVFVAVSFKVISCIMIFSMPLFVFPLDLRMCA